MSEHTALVEGLAEAEAILKRVRDVVDEATGYTVPFRHSRFMPIDSAFTNALYEALGGAPWEAKATCTQTKFPDGTHCGEYGWHASNCPEHDGDDYRGADAD